MASVYGTTPFRSGELKPSTVEKLGPTGRHVKDLLPVKPAPTPQAPPQKPHARGEGKEGQEPKAGADVETTRAKTKGRPHGHGAAGAEAGAEESVEVRDQKTSKFKEFRDIKAVKKQEPSRI